MSDINIVVKIICETNTRQQQKNDVEVAVTGALFCCYFYFKT